MLAATNKHQAKKRRLHDTIILRKVSEADAPCIHFVIKMLFNNLGSHPVIDI